MRLVPALLRDEDDGKLLADHNALCKALVDAVRALSVQDTQDRDRCVSLLEQATAAAVNKTLDTPEAKLEYYNNIIPGVVHKLVPFRAWPIACACCMHLVTSAFLAHNALAACAGKSSHQGASSTATPPRVLVPSSACLGRAWCIDEGGTRAAHSHA